MTVSSSVADGIARLVISRPPLNILSGEVLGALRGELDRLARDATLRVLLLTAEGKHFSAGADVGEHLPPHHLSLIPALLETVTTLVSFPLPVIAAVRGRCLGGGFELVQAADLVVASESAQFGQPEVLLGVIPPVACVLLPLRASSDVAAEVVYSGDLLTAVEAERAGLVRRVVPDPDLDAAALALARRIARHSGATLRIAKRALRVACGEQHATALRAAGELYVHAVMESADALEGLRAFVEKRPPAWSHR